MRVAKKKSVSRVPKSPKPRDRRPSMDWLSKQKILPKKVLEGLKSGKINSIQGKDGKVTFSRNKDGSIIIANFNIGGKRAKGEYKYLSGYRIS